MRIYFIMLLIIAPLAMTAINSHAEEYGFQFLQIPVNPVSAGLAGSGIYADNYAGAFVLNPAANLLDERFSVSVQHSFWLVDTSCNQLVYSNGNRHKHFGLVARMLDYGQIDSYDDNAVPIGTYHPLDAYLMANYAIRIFPDHLIGVNAGLIYEKLDTASSYGLKADLGYVYLTPLTNTNFFVSLRNMGFTSKMDEEAPKLPLTLETGLGYTRPWDNYIIDVQATVVKAVDADMRLNLATQLRIWDMLKLRLGYKFNYDEEGLTAGLGVSWQSFDIDYAWGSNSTWLNDTHSLGITYNF